MTKRSLFQKRSAGKLALLIIVAVLMAACNLGPQSPSEPFTQTPQLGPQDAGGGGEVQVGPTETPFIIVPPTNTPEPQLLESEKLGPISVDGTSFRTQEPITVRVRQGTSVSTVTCSWTHQDTNRQNALGTPTSTTPVAEGVNEVVFTFTPELAGTYVVSCTGVATTINGQQAVSGSGSPFSVEAKG